MKPLYGLYLAGGKSSRMGTPKWALEHLHGQSFLEAGVECLGHVCDKVYVSTAEENAEIPYPQIIDGEEIGPLGGILAAHQAYPEASWLVLACDLPAVKGADLRLLIDHAGEAETVAFLNPIDDVPEATATYYTPAGLEHISEAVSQGQRCMRHALEETVCKTLPAPSPYTLQNVNYPADYTEWQKRAHADYTVKEKRVSLEYYAQLKADAGIEKTTLQTPSYTIAGLWEECRLAHQLSLKQPSVKPAVNNAFVPWDYEVEEGGLIAFMPPFAGG